jgi:hypothetical protein
MKENNVVPNEWEQEKDWLLFVQIIKQGNQLALILENIQTLIKTMETLKDTWAEVENNLTQKKQS